MVERTVYAVVFRPSVWAGDAGAGTGHSLPTPDAVVLSDGVAHRVLGSGPRARAIARRAAAQLRPGHNDPAAELRAFAGGYSSYVRVDGPTAQAGTLEEAAARLTDAFGLPPVLPSATARAGTRRRVLLSA